MQKYQILKINISLKLIKFTKIFVGYNIKSRNLVDKSSVAGFINNADLDKKSSNVSNKS